MQAGFYLLGLVGRNVRVAALVMAHKARRNAYPYREFGCVQKVERIKESGDVILIDKRQVP